MKYYKMFICHKIYTHPICCVKIRTKKNSGAKKQTFYERFFFSNQGDLEACFSWSYKMQDIEAQTRCCWRWAVERKRPVVENMRHLSLTTSLQDCPLLLFGNFGLTEAPTTFRTDKNTHCA